ncbi:MAG: LytTR family DNA-binding domain-containing protein [Bacteroidota bacterium]|nr:LytTR family DNA-binding domain-containing protein [Bacteroidota bacterium]
MKIVIIEDEILTLGRMKKMITALDNTAEIISCLDSIEASIDWFNGNASPDLIFMDIQLADGLCFEIFNTVKIDSPVIFTTAYDEYAIQAFRVNSIDYLLKPVKSEDLKRSLDKYKNLKNQFSPGLNGTNLNEILRSISHEQKVYKARFLVKTGQNYIKVNCQDIAYFLSENKLTYLTLFNGKKYLIDYTLEDLEKELDPRLFFRISRQSIINVNSVESVHTYFSGSLKLYLHPKSEDEVIVSRRRAASFKEWMDM